MLPKSSCFTPGDLAEGNLIWAGVNDCKTRSQSSKSYSTKSCPSSSSLYRINASLKTSGECFISLFIQGEGKLKY